MTIFVDTSAFYAVLCADDPNHDAARKIWLDLHARQEEMLTTNYVLVESFALLQNRLGMEAVRLFQQDAVPLLQIEWVQSTHHLAAVTALVVAGRRQLSLVDCASFETMRRLGINMAFAFDPHFKEQGFICLP